MQSMTQSGSSSSRNSALLSEKSSFRASTVTQGAISRKRRLHATTFEIPTSANVATVCLCLTLLALFPSWSLRKTYVQRRQSNLIKIDEADAADARAHQDRSWTVMSVAVLSRVDVSDQLRSRLRPTRRRRQSSFVFWQLLLRPRRRCFAPAAL